MPVTKSSLHSLNAVDVLRPRRMKMATGIVAKTRLSKSFQVVPIFERTGLRHRIRTTNIKTLVTRELTRRTSPRFRSFFTLSEYETQVMDIGRSVGALAVDNKFRSQR